MSSAAAQGGTYVDGDGAAPGTTPGRGREGGPVEEHEEIRDFTTSQRTAVPNVNRQSFKLFYHLKNKNKKYNLRYVVNKNYLISFSKYL